MKKFKLIALLVAAIMICQSFAVTSAFAADDKSANSAEISAQAVDFLETVGAIVVDKEWSPQGLIGSVTRSYAATVFANIIRGRQTTHYPVVTPILEDVTPGKGNADNIFLAVAYDVIPEVDGKYNEKGLFTFKDMRYALTSLLGYNNYAKATEQGEAIVTKLVNNAKLFDGVNYKANMPLTKTEFAIILKNALHAEMIYQNNYSPDVVSFNKNSGIAMMQEYLGVIKYEGIITATPYSSLSGSNGCQEGEVLLGNMRCNINSTNAADFIGCPVEAYVKVYDEIEKINDILIIDYKSGTKMLEIAAEQLMPGANGFRVTNIIYEASNGRTKRANVSAYGNFFYNGVACDLSVADFRINTGKVTLISTKGSSTYDVVKIDTYVNYVVDYIDEDDKVHSKLGGAPLDLNEDNVNFIDIRRTNNRVVKLNQIKEDNVISAYVSKDGSYVKAILSNTTIDGEIVGVDETEMRTIFTINNGAESQIVKSYYIGTTYPAGFTYPTMHQEGTFYIDANGYLAYAVISPILTKYGYVTGVKRNVGLDTTVTVQLVDEDGMVQELEIPEKGVRTNNYNNKAVTNGKYLPDTVHSILSTPAQSTNNAVDMYKLVRFSAKNGMLSRLDFAADKSGTKDSYDDYFFDEIFELNKFEATRRYDSHTKTLGTRLGTNEYGVNDDTLIFMLNNATGAPSIDNIRIANGNALIDRTDYTDVYMYDADSAMGIGVAVVRCACGSMPALTGTAIFDSMYSAIDEADEESYTYIKYWYQGKLNTKALAEGATMPTVVNKGDAIFVTTDAKGMIAKIVNAKDKLWNNVSASNVECGDNGTGLNDSYNYAVAGYAMGKNSFRLAVDLDGTAGYDIRSFLLKNPTVYVVEYIDNKTVISVSGMAAVNTSTDNTDSNKIILSAYAGQVNTIVVYK